MTATPEPHLVLASASPRRRELLERLGLVLEVVPAAVDETPLPGEKPTDYARRVAAAKCDAVADGPAADRGLAVLGADTTVVIEESILGKPADDADARAMLLRLAGRRHQVVTAYTLRFGARRLDRAVTTLVAMRALQPAEIDAYVASGEGRDKAGAYAVQGIAAAFVTELRGSLTNVIGLPLAGGAGDLLALGALPRYPAGGLRRCREMTRAETIAEGLAQVRARDRRRREGRRAGAGLGPLLAVSKKMTPTTCAPRSPPASGPSARLRARSCATSGGRWPRIPRCHNRRVAPHRPAAEQQGEVRRRPGGARSHRRFGGAAGGDRGAGARSRPASFRSTSPAKPRSAGSRRPSFPRCSTGSRRCRTPPAPD